MGDLPPEVKEFIGRYILSVEQLEVLLFLRENAQQFFSAQAVSKHLRSSPRSIQKRLEELKQQGFLTTRGEEYRFEPNETLAKQVDHLAAVYVERRISIIELIFNRPLSAIRDFADAFKLKKEDPKDG
jgi:biotin operon repressor